ncbi:MAG: PHP domain-containing protein [Gammaproteobacteria bacterium]
MSFPVDLHLHSTASDGALPPAELVRLAHRHGVRCLALTDHDTVEGISAAARAALDLEMGFLAGIELSVSWQGIDVHVVGLGIDPGNPTIRDGIAFQQQQRAERAVKMAEKLERKGFAGALQGARSVAGEATVTRTHFARWLVEARHAPDLQSAFKRYLRRGKPGYVRAEWASLSVAIDWIRQAGGRAVLAHPLRYPLSLRKLRRLIGEFGAAGGIGLEVVSGPQTFDRTELLAQLCDWHGMLGSCGSDFHSPDQAWLVPGRIAAFPRGCAPIWRDWPELEPYLASAA